MVEQLRKYTLYANLIVAVHAVWTLVLWGSMALTFVHPAYAPFAFVMLTITLLSNIPLRGICPLTSLEERFRQKVAPSYATNHSFMTTYINKIFRTRFGAEQVNTVIAIIYVAAYGWLTYLMFGGSGQF